MKHRRILANWTAVASISLVSYGGMAAVTGSPHPGRLPDPVVELPTLRIWAVQGETLLGAKFKHPLAAAIIANDIPKLKAGLNPCAKIAKKVMMDVLMLAFKLSFLSRIFILHPVSRSRV